MAPGSPRFLQLDGLRAVAIILVVAHHSLTSSGARVLRSVQLPKAAELLEFSTRSGVELFFVLSGVVLLRPYLRRTRPFRAGTYLRRRAERLWPPYVVTLLFASAVLALPRWHPTWYSDVLPRFSPGGMLVQAGIVNLGWPSYSGAWWSLNLELFFYLLVPLLVAGFLALRSRPSGFAAFGGLAVVGSLVASEWLSSSGDLVQTAAGGETGPSVLGAGQITALFFVFLPCFAIGAALARFSFTPRIGRILIVVGSAHCVVGLFAPALNIHLGFGLLYGGIVILAQDAGSRLAERLSGSQLVWLGERSYSLFLVHFPVFYLVNYLTSLVVPRRGPAYFVVTRGVGLPAALLAAMAVFWLVERRFARGLTTADRFWPPIGAVRQPSPALRRNPS